jgi:hypothetical protein
MEGRRQVCIQLTCNYSVRKKLSHMATSNEQKPRGDTMDHKYHVPVNKSDSAYTS